MVLKKLHPFISHENFIASTSMDLDRAFHMKGGLGDSSYPKNSLLQKKAADKVKHITREAIEKMYTETKPTSIGIADMGCSSGPNTLSTIKHLVRAVEGTSQNTQEPGPEIRIYLNDLPTNDFNTVFQALPHFYSELKEGRSRAGPAVYIAAYPGTFYGRLFPVKSLHFVYSSHSLHWLSKIPAGVYDDQNTSINKESIYISGRTPSKVTEAYHKQFQEDFSVFLRSRSEEVVSGGRMVLLLLGRSGPLHADRGISFLWDILYQSLAILVAQGEIEEEKLGNYEVNFYAPSKEELEEVVTKEGSFRIEEIGQYGADKDAGNWPSYGVALAKAVRSIQEPMIAHHFGFGEAILDRLFQLYGRLADQEMAKEGIESISMFLVLAKL